MLPWVLLLVVLAVTATQPGDKVGQLWQSNPGIARPQVVEFAQDSFSNSDELIQSRYDWRYFKSAAETRNLFILKGEDPRVFLIPKRAFTNPDELALIKAIMRDRIAETDFLETPKRGFEVQTPRGG
jgi:hypothetical protein